ncbi:uncharacterized protein LY89DRAFT_687677 [Mollisia scopiformis]|uniref:Uncharacterized protein n=1 Tax=Mollisia scopiformis TaxID=149040 RepID=A0A194WYE8_MOLSC|nr:uncharacterized protein LY89DRAFT_687677 [Mollisia scopiformis]KUJ12709.1 hypothetical protein LY89DRAFT_687677 [Mollisia scopiformis]
MISNGLHDTTPRCYPSDLRHQSSANAVQQTIQEDISGGGEVQLGPQTALQHPDTYSFLDIVPLYQAGPTAVASNWTNIARNNPSIGWEGKFQTSD